MKLDNSNVCGLVYRTELSDHEPPKKFNTIFQTGDKVKVLVTKVEKEKKRVLLSMKPSHFDLDEEDEDNEEEGATTHNSVLQQKLKQLLELQQEEKQKRNARTADEVEEGEKDEEEEAEETTKEEKRSAKKARVEEATPKKGVKRSAQEEEEEEEDNAEEEEDEEDEKHQTPSLNSSTLSFEHVDVDDEITFKTPKKKTRVEADSTSTKSTKTPTSTTTSAKSSAVVHNLPSVNAPALQVSAGFGFDAAFNSLTSEAHSRNNDDDDDDDDGESYAKEIGDDDDDDEDNEDNEDGDSKSKQRRLTKSAKKEEEKRIAQAEKELLAKDTNTPESVEDFERLVLASPNSSYAWIKFMAFYLSSSEVDKARNVGEQALKIISYREERERLNIWIALLNLENKFGTAETLKQTLARALANADPKKVYFQLASIYEMTPGRRLVSIIIIIVIIKKK